MKSPMRSAVPRGKPNVCAVMVLVALLLGGTLIAACDFANDEPDPTVATTSAPPTSEPSWMSEFSDAEIAAYEAGLAWFETYDLMEEAVLREGKATAEAKRLYQENRTDWQSAWRDLQLYEKQKIVFPRRPEVLSTEPSVINLGEGTEVSLRILRCVDSRVVKATIDGEPLEVANDYPTEQTVALNRHDDGKWRVLTVKTSGERCDG